MFTPHSESEENELSAPLFDDLAQSVRIFVSLLDQRGLLHGDVATDVVDRALRFAKAYLRSMTLPSRTSISTQTMRSLLFIKIFKLLIPQDETPANEQCPSTSSVFQEASEYLIRLHEKPKYHVGGDVACFYSDERGQVWIILADVMGKGVAAHLTAASLRILWEIGHQESIARGPLDFLQWLENEITDYLPDGVFIETALINANTGGNLNIAAAGFVEFLTGNLSQQLIEVQKFGGMYLGKGFPELFSCLQLTIPLRHEVVFATDGVFDQPDVGGRLRSSLPDRLRNPQVESSMHDAVVQIIGESLQIHPQFDDVTVVSLTRTGVNAGKTDGDHKAV